MANLISIELDIHDLTFIKKSIADRARLLLDHFDSVMEKYGNEEIQDVNIDSFNTALAEFVEKHGHEKVAKKVGRPRGSKNAK